MVGVHIWTFWKNNHHLTCSGSIGKQSGLSPTGWAFSGLTLGVSCNYSHLSEQTGLVWLSSPHKSGRKYCQLSHMSPTGQKASSHQGHLQRQQEIGQTYRWTFVWPLHVSHLLRSHCQNKSHSQSQHGRQLTNAIRQCCYHKNLVHLFKLLVVYLSLIHMCHVSAATFQCRYVLLLREDSTACTICKMCWWWQCNFSLGNASLGLLSHRCRWCWPCIAQLLAVSPLS